LSAFSAVMERPLCRGRRGERQKLVRAAMAVRAEHEEQNNFAKLRPVSFPEILAHVREQPSFVALPDAEQEGHQVVVNSATLQWGSVASSESRTLLSRQHARVFRAARAILFPAATDGAGGSSELGGRVRKPAHEPRALPHLDLVALPQFHGPGDRILIARDLDIDRAQEVTIPTDEIDPVIQHGSAPNLAPAHPDEGPDPGEVWDRGRHLSQLAPAGETDPSATLQARSAPSSQVRKF
jgi:hypothetical protein